MNQNIAIDGPAGSGKSTIAKLIAKKVGAIYVDTGAMYRAIGFFMLENHILEQEEEKIKEALKNLSIEISYENGIQQIFLNGKNITSQLREEKVGKAASAYAKNPDVRSKLVEMQRELAQKKIVVMDGRDIGTKVLPDAGLKIYLTASTRERAKRRYLELSSKGETASLEEIEQDMIERDKQDMNREYSPLCQAKDAILIDTSGLTIDEVTKKIWSLYQERLQK